MYAGHQECKIMDTIGLSPQEAFLLQYILGRTHFAVLMYSSTVFQENEPNQKYTSIPITLLNIPHGEGVVSNETMQRYHDDLLEVRAMHSTASFAHLYHTNFAEEVLAQKCRPNDTSDKECNIIIAGSFAMALDHDSVDEAISFEDLLDFLQVEIIINLLPLATSLRTINLHRSLEEIFLDPQFQFLIAEAEIIGIEEITHVIDSLLIFVRAVGDGFAYHDQELIRQGLQVLREYPDIDAA